MLICLMAIFFRAFGVLFAYNALCYSQTSQFNCLIEYAIGIQLGTAVHKKEKDLSIVFAFAPLPLHFSLTTTCTFYLAF